MEPIHDLIHEITNEHIGPVVQLMQRYQQEGRLPCSCRDCLLDIAAITLNTMKPRYTVSFVKDLYESDADRRRYMEELRHAMNVACARVRAHPHHNREEASAQA